MVEAFSIVAVVAVAVQAGALVVLHVLPTGYSPVRDAVSDYGVGRYRGVYWLQLVAGAAAGIALAIALAESHPSKPTLAVVMLLVSALARLVLLAFPTDHGGSRFETVTGTVHMVLAVTIFASLIIAASELSGTLGSDPAWHDVKGLVEVLPWVMTVSAVGILVALRAPRLKLISGLIERLFYVSSIAWFLVVAIELAKIGT